MNKYFFFSGCSYWSIYNERGYHRLLSVNLPMKMLRGLGVLGRTIGVKTGRGNAVVVMTVVVLLMLWRVRLHEMS